MEEAFWLAGNKITKHTTRSSITVGQRRFREHFGTTPQVCSIIWAMLEAQSLHSHDALPIHMLCALLFLKGYNTESVNRSLTGFDEKTNRKWQWVYVELIALNLPNVVRKHANYPRILFH
jgi:hypothetical protein